MADSIWGKASDSCFESKFEQVPLECSPQLARWGRARPAGSSSQLGYDAACELRGILIAFRGTSLGNRAMIMIEKISGRENDLMSRHISFARTWLQAEWTGQDVLVCIMTAVNQTPAGTINTNRERQPLVAFGTERNFRAPSTETALARRTRDCKASIKVKYGCSASRALALECL
jgi:hypothetical protein